MRVLHVTPCANPELARTLLKIQHAAYALEATLIDDDRIPALHEDVEDLRSAPLLWLAASIDGRLVGALAWSENDEELDIDRLVVAPDMHRRGAGSALVREVLQRAGKRHAVVSTGRDNTPAKAWPRPGQGLAKAWPRPCTSSWGSRGPKMKRSSRDCG